MLTAFEKIKKVIPAFTQQNFKHYKFWKDNLEILDEMIEGLVESRKPKEAEIDAIKRLGQIDFLLDQKKGVKTYDEIIRRCKDD